MSRCFNCNSESKKLACSIQVGKNYISLPEVLSSIFKSQVNVARKDKKNKVATLVLCSDCVTLFKQIYKSRDTFLRLTSRTSDVGRIVYGSCKPETIQTFLKREKCIQRVKNSKHNYTADPVAHKGESILPDFEEDEPNLHQSVFPWGENSNKIIDYQEIYPRLISARLTQDEVKKFSFTSSLMLFKTNGSSQTVSICSECKRVFISPELMKNHYNSVHVPLKTELSCKFCDKRFSSEWFYKTHVEKFHCGIQIQYSCHICRESYPEQQKLEEHKLKDHDIRENPFNCNHCPDSFYDIDGLRAHLIEKHTNSQEAAAALSNKNVKNPINGRMCSLCDEKFLMCTQLAKHMKSKHGNVKLSCNFCEKVFETPNKLMDHERCHTSCPLCSKSLENHKSLVSHMKKGHDVKFKCEICGQCFRQTTSINRHYRWHSNIGSPFHHCNICSRSYPLKSQLVQHLKSCHTGPKEKISCGECSKKFTHKCQLNRHLELVHKQESKYECEICGKKFMWPTSLLRHGWTHSRKMFTGHEEKVSIVNLGIRNTHRRKPNLPNGERPKLEIISCFSTEMHIFTCPICKKGEEGKSHFIRHLRTHNLAGYSDPIAENNLPRDLKCPEPGCIKYFSRKDNVAKHVRVYHDKESKQYDPKPFTCKICKTRLLSMMMFAHGERHMIKIQSPKDDTKKKKDLNSYFNDDTKLLTCSTCQESFPIEKQNEFIQHLKIVHQFKIVHPSSKANVFACAECKRSFDSLLKREKHFLTSHCTKN